MNEITFIVVDIETDGPNPGCHSMLNLAAVACHHDGRIKAEFTRNLELLPEGVPDPGTLAWWETLPEVYARLRTDLESPGTAINNFVEFVDGFEGDRVIVAHPLSFDGAWIDYYLRRFADLRLFTGPFGGRSLFFGAGIDLPSYAMGVLGEDYRRCRRECYPKELLGPTEHTHHGLDDARGHAEFFGALHLRQLALTDKAINGG